MSNTFIVLSGEIESQLNDLAIEYLRFLAWEKVYTCGKTFTQLVDDVFHGDIEIAYQHFLNKIFHEFTCRIFQHFTPVFEWVLAKNIKLTPKQKTDLIYKIRDYIVDNSVDEMKELLGLIELSCK